MPLPAFTAGLLPTSLGFGKRVAGLRILSKALGGNGVDLCRAETRDSVVWRDLWRSCAAGGLLSGRAECYKKEGISML